jgi:hypothetical protein
MAALKTPGNYEMNTSPSALNFNDASPDKERFKSVPRTIRETVRTNIGIREMALDG